MSRFKIPFINKGNKAEGQIKERMFGVFSLHLQEKQMGTYVHNEVLLSPIWTIIVRNQLIPNLLTATLN